MMFQKIKDYYCELFLVLVIIIVLFYSYRILEKFQNDVDTKTADEERIRYAGMLSFS